LIQRFRVLLVGAAFQPRLVLSCCLIDRGWKGRVRVSQCGCMGLCAKGPNVMIYPQKSWFSAVTSEDANDIITRIESMLEK